MKKSQKKSQKRKDAMEAPAASGKIAARTLRRSSPLQVQLTRLQTWVKAKGARVIVVFEGRDTAGKGGVISRITARTSPRVYRHVALPAPSDRERSQVFIQRTSRNSRRRARSSCSTVPGTTGPGLSG